MAIRLDSPDLGEALDALGEFYQQNTTEGRRTLKRTVAQKQLEANTAFIESVSDLEIVNTSSSHPRYAKYLDSC